MPKVSIIVPTYNRSAFLNDCLRSILKQDFTDFEIVVSDNASTDDTESVVKKINDNRVVYHKNTVNLGATLNHNKALELCRGEYIQIFSDDDIMLPQCLESNVTVLDANPSVGIVHSDISIINGAGEITSDKHWATLVWKKWEAIHSVSQLFSNKIYHTWLYRIHNLIAMPAVMIRKSIITKVGYMDTDLKYYIDWHYWLKISLFYDVYYINKKLVLYRLHKTNVFGSATGKELVNERRLIRKILERDYPNDLIVKNNIGIRFLEENNFYADYNYFKVSKKIVSSVVKHVLGLNK